MKKIMRSAILTSALVCAVSGLAMAAPIISLTDPVGDDYGPGNYTYPGNEVFVPKAFDLTGFKIEDSGDNVIFTIENASDLTNPWGAQNGISVQMYQIYIDTNPADSNGFTDGIPGANIVFDKPWKKAILCEGGWGTEVEGYVDEMAPDTMKPAIFVAKNDQTPVTAQGNKLMITVPKSFVGQPSANWGVQVAVLGQEGSKESMDGIKIRQVRAEATDWQFGGAIDESVFHPNTIDIFMPAGKDQKAVLSSFSVNDETFAKVPMIYSK